MVIFQEFVGVDLSDGLIALFVIVFEFSSIIWITRSSNISFSCLSSFFSCFKFLFFSLSSSPLRSLSRFESLLKLGSFTDKDDGFILLGSLKHMISLSIFLQAFKRFVPGIACRFIFLFLFYRFSSYFRIFQFVCIRYVRFLEMLFEFTTF